LKRGFIGRGTTFEGFWKSPWRYLELLAGLKKFEGMPANLRIIAVVTNEILMKKIKTVTAAILAITTLTAPLAGLAADQNTDAKTKAYPLKTCVVSGEKLGEMGKPVVYVHEGREIKFCCKDCIKDFKKDPAKYVKKLDEAEAKAKKS
jgi:YHS domain-containing protein